MFQLAWMGKGFQLNLKEVPDPMLKKFEEWAKEIIDRQNEELPQS